MSRPASPVRSALALFLATQPVFWTSQVARAQALEAQGWDAPRPEQRPSPEGSPPAGTAPFPSDRASGSDVPLGSTFPFGSKAPPLGGTGEEEGPRASPPPAAAAAAGLPAVDGPIDPAKYVLGPGDVLQLDFWGLKDASLRLTVDIEGRAFVPKYGFIPLDGKTLTEARERIQDSVGRFYPGLRFGLSLVLPRTFVVQVADAIARPGGYQARATDRVASVITRAGGLAANASKRRIELRRRDGTVHRVDLLLYALTGDVRHNPFLLDGDVVRVPFEGLAATISGAVNRPGRYEIVGTGDLAELVELAGGLAPSATRELPLIRVRRGADERLHQEALPFPASGGLPAMPLQQEDSVYVPSLSEVQRSVTVVGAMAGVSSSDEAKATRRLPFAQGETVRTLVERVGGLGPLADLRRGFIGRGQQAIPVDLYALVVLRDQGADRPIELGDTLVIPFVRRNILVEGAVFKPGSYQFNPTYGIEQYVALAGGLNRFAQGMEDTYVVNPDGIRHEYSVNLKVEPGSSLIVPERSFSRSEVVGIILSATGIILSGVAVILAARK